MTAKEFALAHENRRVKVNEHREVFGRVIGYNTQSGCVCVELETPPPEVIVWRIGSDTWDDTIFVVSRSAVSGFTRIFPEDLILVDTPATPKIDMSRYPHTCPNSQCKAQAYVTDFSVDCSAGCKVWKR